MAGEFEYISWLRARTPSAAGVLVGPGDDCAVLAPPARPLLVTTDVLTDGTDFLLHECGARAAGRKAMAANLSDIAAMAGTPRFAVVGVVLPRAGGGAIARELYLGLRACADEFGVALVGGDTNSWDGKLVVSVTVLGEAHPGGAVTRAGARPGDWLFVTGPLGGSIRGRHLTFTPRLREAQALTGAVRLRAMCDISDGLAADLNHILEESRCGAVLRAAAVPVAADAHELARATGRPALRHALTDGEDFELVFAVAPDDGARLLRAPPVPGLAHIGECVESGLWLETDGAREPLKPDGWTHFVGE